MRSSATKHQTSSQPSSSACHSTTAARLYRSNRPSGTATSSLVSKSSNLSVHAGDNAKRVSQTSKVSQAENVKKAENVKERCLPYAEPRKPGPAASRSKHEARAVQRHSDEKKAGLSISTTTAAQPITAKKAIRASKVSHVENVKRRSLPHAEPRKPGEPLRTQNTKAAPCIDPVVIEEAGHFISRKTAAQPITAKKAIRAREVRPAENLKRPILPHAEPQKPGQPLRTQNTKAAPCSDPAVREEAVLSISTKTAAQPITSKKAIRAREVRPAENLKRPILPHAEPQKPGQPLRTQNTKAAPCSDPVVREEAVLSISTKTAAQPITAKKAIPAREVRLAENLKRPILPHAEPQKQGQPLRTQNTKAAPCSDPAVREEAVLFISTKTPAQPITAKQAIRAREICPAENLKRSILPHAEPQKPGQPLRTQNTKAAQCIDPAVREEAGLFISTKTPAQPITAKQAIRVREVCPAENLKRPILPHAEPQKPGQPLRTQNTKAAPCNDPAVREEAGLFISTKTPAQPITAKQAIRVREVCPAENLKRPILPHAEPQKPGQPLRTQNTKAAPCNDPAVREEAGLFISTKTPAQPITAKQAIRAREVCPAENLKRPILPHEEPQKPGQPLRTQNTKAAPCSGPAVREEAVLFISTKTPAQPITAKQAIRAREVCPAENLKRPILPHAEPQKPGQPLRTQNTKAAQCIDPSVREEAGLFISTKRAAEPITAKKAIRAREVCPAENLKRPILPHAEPQKPGQPLRTKNTKATPCSGPAVREEAVLFISTKTPAQPITAKQAIRVREVYPAENLKRPILPHAEPQKPGQPLRTQNTKAAPCSDPAVREEAVLFISTKTPAKPITAKQAIRAREVCPG
ncbi:hypothetical protein MRX96_002404 [Rhipicephalus microplus]